MLKFVFSRSFVINLLVAVFLLSAILIGIFKFINHYTAHGESTTVPMLEGLKINEVEALLQEKGLRYQILDSIYLENMEKGVVLDQNPLPESLVKANRTIYITTSKTITPKLSMPNVVDMSKRLAIAKLESYGLKVGALQYIPSECVNCVLKQQINGKNIAPGTMINNGKTIDLILGQGTSNEKVRIPYLINNTKEEAIEKLQASSLNIGASIYDKCETKEDSMQARVYKQSINDNGKNEITMGSSIDLWFTSDTSSIVYAPPLDSTFNDSVK